MVAIDSDTGRVLSEEEAEHAADNPHIYTWVVWREVLTIMPLTDRLAA